MASPREDDNKDVKGAPYAYFPPPQLYPSIPGYSFIPQWCPPPMYPAAQMIRPPYMDHHQCQAHNSFSHISNSTNENDVTTQQTDDYMVNTMRRIYNNNDGSIEIERVKVHRISGVYDQTALPNYIPITVSGATISSVSMKPMSKRQPPPRRKKKRHQVPHVPTGNSDIREAWAKHVSNFPYGYPYPYGIMMPVITPQIIGRAPGWQFPESSDSSAKCQDGVPLPITCNENIPSDPPNRGSQSPEIFHSFSTGSSSLFGEPQITDITPSDRFSMKDYKGEMNIDSIIEKSLKEEKSLKSPPLPIKLKINLENNSAGNQSCVSVQENKTTPDSDLVYAFKKLERNVDTFKTNLREIVQDKKNVETWKEDKLDLQDQLNKFQRDFDLETSQSSTITAHSTLHIVEEPVADTDSTEIYISSDGESGQSQDNFQWILLNATSIDENLQDSENNDLSIVDLSLWRAQLIVILCRGQGLDEQAWDVFQMLVQNILPLQKKLSLLNANQICSVNNNVGVALLRNSLLHVIKHGEILLKPESERDNGWTFILADEEQSWTQVKGCLEILNVFGYKMYEQGKLTYRRKLSPEISVIARLTLDILILAEEFRLYLTGIHSRPQNITQLFTKNFNSKLRESPAMQSFCNVNINIPSASSDLAISGHIDNENNETIIVETNHDPAMKFQTEEAPTDKTNNNSLQADQQPNLDTKVSVTKAEIDIMKSKNPVNPEQKDEKINEEIDITSKNNEKLDDCERSKQLKIEEHIYEEIAEVKAQIRDVQRKSLPPPLPPKSKTFLVLKDAPGNNDYSDSDYSSSLISSSRGGSTARRMKKRRAPMPPNFIMEGASGVSEASGAHQHINRGTRELKESLSIEEIEPKMKEKSELNPFYTGPNKPSGYIGKNPFYEDIESENCENDTKLHSHKLVQPSEIKHLPENVLETRTVSDVSKTIEQQHSVAAKGAEICDASVHTIHQETLLATKKYVSSSDSYSSSAITVVPTNPDTTEIMDQSNKTLVLIDSQIDSHSTENNAVTSGHNISLNVASETPHKYLHLNSETLVTQKFRESVGVATDLGEAEVRTLDKYKSINNNIGINRVRNELPNNPTSNSTLKLINDIPYIDTHFMKEDNIKNELSVESMKIMQEYNMSSENIISSVLHTEEQLPISMKAISFIDDFDLPPDCSPPPPPESPPTTSDSSPPSFSEQMFDVNSVNFDTLERYIQNNLAGVPMSECNGQTKKENNKQENSEIKRLSLNKESWSFPRREVKEEVSINRSSETYSSKSDSERYEIPENLHSNKCIVEDRFQNPLQVQDTIFQKNDKSFPKKPEVQDHCRISDSPKRPSRKKKLHTSPPRPPKPAELLVPTLPPRSSPLESVCSTLPPSSKPKPMMIKPPVSPPTNETKQSYIMPQSTSYEQTQAKHTKRIEIHTDICFPNKSTSTPSSPKLTSERLKNIPGSSKTRKSWPSIFCDCVHPDKNNYDNPPRA